MCFISFLSTKIILKNILKNQQISLMGLNMWQKKKKKNKKKNKLIIYIYGHIQTNKINKKIPILLYGCGIVVLILGLMTIAFH